MNVEERKVTDCHTKQPDSQDKPQRHPTHPSTPCQCPRPHNISQASRGSWSFVSDGLFTAFRSDLQAYERKKLDCVNIV